MQFLTATLALTLVSLALITPTVAEFKCNYPGEKLQRKEWRQLSRDERIAYTDAVAKLYARGTSGTGQFSYIEDYSRIHDQNNPWIHGYASFLPWHRYFVVIYEQALQKVSNSKITVPYWKWTIDSQAPEEAPIWGLDLDSLGARGQPGTDCVKGGRFEHLQVFGSCIKRRFNKGNRLGAFHGPESINRLIAKSKDYDEFRRELEGNAHAVVHTSIGGHMSTMNSPNDPIFWLHHSMIDKLWYDWQVAHNGFNEYSGKIKESKLNGGKKKAFMDEPMYPFTGSNGDKEYYYTVGYSLNPTNLCYTYEEMPAQAVRKELPKPDVPLVPKVRQPEPEPEHHRHHLFHHDDDDDREDRGRLGHHHRDLRNDGGDDASQAPISTQPVKPIAVDDKVTVNQRTEAAPVTPKSDDRTYLISIRVPEPIPSDWLKANGLDEEEVRQHEKKHETLVNDINKIPHYVSPAALWNVPRILGQLVKEANKETTPTTFTAQFGKYDIKIDAKTVKDVNQAVANLHARVRATVGVEHLNQGRPEVQQALTTLIGTPSLSKFAADNPFAKFNTGVEDKPAVKTEVKPEVKPAVKTEVKPVEVTAK